VPWSRGGLRWKVTLVSFLYIYNKCAVFLKFLYFLTCPRIFFGWLTVTWYLYLYFKKMSLFNWKLLGDTQYKDRPAFTVRNESIGILSEIKQVKRFLFSTITEPYDHKTVKYTCAGFGVFTAMRIQVVVFWVMTPCSDVVGYQYFGGPCWLHFDRENGGATRILPCHYTVSQPKRHRPENILAYNLMIAGETRRFVYTYIHIHIHIYHTYISTS
jgi:hypothetical protein